MFQYCVLTIEFKNYGEQFSVILFKKDSRWSLSPHGGGRNDKSVSWIPNTEY